MLPVLSKQEFLDSPSGSWIILNAIAEDYSIEETHAAWYTRPIARIHLASRRDRIEDRDLRVAFWYCTAVTEARRGRDPIRGCVYCGLPATTKCKLCAHLFLRGRAERALDDQRLLQIV